MNINEKIRRIRESKEWSQEQMAEKLNMSLNGYAKIERGETKLYLDKLEQIAQILDIDVVILIKLLCEGKPVGFIDECFTFLVCLIIAENSNS